MRGRADACQGLSRCPSDAGNGIGQGAGEVPGRDGRLRTDGCQGLRRVDANVRILVRERRHERAYRRTCLRAQSAQGCVRHRPRPSSPRLSVPVSTTAESTLYRAPGRSRNQRRYAGRNVLMTKQFNQQRNGRRTNPPDDLKGPQIEIFIATVEETSQQRQRTPRPLDQGGFGHGPDLRVFGHQAICPVQHRQSSWKDPNPRPGAAEGMKAWFERLLVWAEPAGCR